VPAGSIPTNFPGLVEDDHFNSLRVGLSSQFMLTERLRLTADVAYLPLVDFKGQDDHNARELLIPEASNSGNGVMLEAILDYAITDAWNVGIGGRYWAWNMRTGTVTFNQLGSNQPPLIEPGRFNTERYGAFVQTSYKWGDTTRAAPAAAALPTKAPILAAAPMNWAGFYIGGHLGGGWSNDRWSDPFGPTPGTFGAINFAGFGDRTHATGPLGGGQIGFNLQTGSWVLGIEADASAADLRGENTCFSGLVGLNCQRVVEALGSVTGRVGFAWDRSLAYVKGGGAWTNTTYNLNGVTNVLTLGSGSTSATAWGWTAGGGIEYALTYSWTARLEYDHIDVPGTTVSFPTVALVNTQNISVRQWIDVVKLGVNYKLDWNPFAGG
jgi:opacity protein-like surface antigen